MRLTYAIAFVSDMDRSVAFYRDVVGLSLRFESPDWCEFATEGATLALHASEDAEPDDPRRLLAGRCRFGLGVADIDVFHARMIEKGVACLQPPQEISGARIADYLDPDGLAFSVGEPPREA